MSTTPDNASYLHIAEQSQWAQVRREFRKRKLAVVSWWGILILISVSVFAPFLANNKPLFYRGVNRFDYNETVRTITTLGLKISRLPAEPTADDIANASREVGIIRHMGDLLAGNLPDEQAADIETQVATIADTAERAIDDPSARPELNQLRIEFRRNAQAAAEFLAPTTHWPVFAVLTWPEVWFMVFTPLLILFPVWKHLPRRCDPAGRFKLIPLTFVGLPTLAALVWWLNVPERIDRTNYRAGVASDASAAERAPVTFDSVVWPLVPYALDESNLDLKYGRPAHLAGLFTPLVRPDEAAVNKEKSDQLTKQARQLRAQSTDEAVAEAEQLEQQAAALPVVPWSRPHVMGTDDTGRDVFCRMIWGGRVSLSVGIVAVSIYVTIGIVVGAIAGYFRGVADMLISRVIEIVICFPSFFLILAIVAFLGPSIFNIMLVIGLTSWTGVARLVRGEFLRLSEQEFVLAGRALGYSPWRIIFRHILPNALAPVLVSATFGVAGAILIESSLSFLNLGISVPTPSWGGILASGRDSIERAPWIIFFPGLAIFITITAYNLVGEAFRDAADPRLRGRHG